MRIKPEPFCFHGHPIGWFSTLTVHSWSQSQSSVFHAWISGEYSPRNYSLSRVCSMPGSQGSAHPGTTVSVECVPCLDLRGVLTQELQSQSSVFHAWISGECSPRNYSLSRVCSKPGSQGSAHPGTTVSVECVPCLDLRGVLTQELQSQSSVFHAWISGEYSPRNYSPSRVCSMPGSQGSALPGTTVSVECVPCLDLRESALPGTTVSVVYVPCLDLRGVLSQELQSQSSVSHAWISGEYSPRNYIPSRVCSMPRSQGSALPGTTVSVECVPCLDLRGVLTQEPQSQSSVFHAWISGEYFPRNYIPSRVCLMPGSQGSTLPGTTVSVECVPCLDLRGVLSQALQ